MKNPPPIEEIKKWLKGKDPLGLFAGELTITDIDPKPWSGHFNYLIETPDKQLVLRFKGPEWGSPEGMIDEYTALAGVGQYDVGPKVLYVREDFFGEPAVLEERLVGRTLDTLSESELNERLPDVARFIAKINGIPFNKADFRFQKPRTNYERDREEFRSRAGFLSGQPAAQECGKAMTALLPTIMSLLDRYEAQLSAVLKAQGNAFIFESAHIGHCLLTENGFRFFNWEEVTYGDPSFTLAVFLVSIHRRPGFEDMKRRMIESYPGLKDIKGFRELIEQRITERHLANIFWRIETAVKRAGIPPPGWEEELAKAETLVGSL